MQKNNKYSECVNGLVDKVETAIIRDKKSYVLVLTSPKFTHKAVYLKEKLFFKLDERFNHLSSYVGFFGNVIEVFDGAAVMVLPANEKSISKITTYKNRLPDQVFIHQVEDVGSERFFHFYKKMQLSLDENCKVDGYVEPETNDYKKVICIDLGIKSVAMTLLLYEQGHRYPIVYADTGNQYPETYVYKEKLTNYLKYKYGAGIITLNPPLTYYNPEVIKHQSESILQYCEIRKKLPSIESSWCSYEFKRTPLQKYTIRIGYDKNLIALTVDEKNKIEENKKDCGITDEYPLIEKGLNEEDCAEIIKKAGLELHHKTYCTLCPHQNESQLEELNENHPEIYAHIMTAKEK